MAILKNGASMKAYQGDHAPINIYKGDKKIAGYIKQTKNGESVEYNLCYNDEADVLIEGNTVQISDWYAKDGLCSQVQTVQGKNLFDKNKTTFGYAVTAADGSLVPVANAHVTRLLVKANTSYTVSNPPVWANRTYARYLDSTGAQLSHGSVVSSHFTTPANCVAMDYYYYNGASGAMPLADIQIEEGGTATVYTPFVPNSPSPDYPSPITSNLSAGTYKYTSTDGIYEFTLPEELRGIDTTVDKIVFDRISHTGYLERRIGKVDYDGVGEAWNKTGGSGHVTHTEFQIDLLSAERKSDNSSVLMCNRLPWKDADLIWNGDIEGAGINSVGALQVCVANYRLSTLDNSGFLQWLIANPLSICYKKSTPTRTPLTFTKVANSARTEVPMTFLTNTPSLDYKAQVYDVSGKVKSRGKNILNNGINYNNWATQFNPFVPVEEYYENGIMIHDAIHPVTGYNDRIAFLKVDLKAGQTCTLSYSVGDNTALPSKYLSNAGSLAQYFATTQIGTTNRYKGTFTCTNDFKYLGLYVNANSGKYAKIYDIMLEDGVTNGEYFEESRIPTEVTLPTLRKIGTVADTFNPKTGELIKRISDWITLDGSKNWLWFATPVGYRQFATSVIGAKNVYDGGVQISFKYDSKTLSLLRPYDGADRLWVSDQAYLSVPNEDSGFNDASTPSANEIKAYFYGWKMCNADGTSPYYKSEVPYTPSTWAEWTTTTGLITKDVTGVTITGTSELSRIQMSSTLKPSTKYGVLMNILSNTVDLGVYVQLNYAQSVSYDYGRVGNVKGIITTGSSISSNNVRVMTNAGASGSAKLKDIRIFELPVGSQIESDFNAMTADQLAAKYTFNGLCTKNWKKVTDGSGQAAVLPTASYPEYTPYKMLYQLATPVVSNLDESPLETFYPYTKIESDAINAKPNIIATVKVEE